VALTACGAPPATTCPVQRSVEVGKSGAKIAAGSWSPAYRDPGLVSLCPENATSADSREGTSRVLWTVRIHHHGAVTWDQGAVYHCDGQASALATVCERPMAQNARFQRSNLVVADMQRSLAVYRDALGLSVDYMKDSLPTSYSYPVFQFPPEAKLRFCTLSSDEQVRVLALTEVTGIALPAPNVPRTAALVFQVQDMDATVRALEALPGVHGYAEEQLRTQDGRVGREKGIVDPDGHLIVLYSILAAN